MKDKEKQIEEMAKALLEYIKAYGKLHLTVDGIDNTARLFVKFGITKLPKDSVVLSREEFEELKQYEEKVKSGACFTQKEWLDLCDEECKRNTENLSKARQLARKETAEKILKEIEKLCYFNHREYSCGEIITLRDVNELAKQFGVEIKE